MDILPETDLHGDPENVTQECMLVSNVEHAAEGILSVVLDKGDTDVSEHALPSSWSRVKYEI
jgi:hypothetical protein